MITHVKHDISFLQIRFKFYIVVSFLNTVNLKHLWLAEVV